MSTTAAPERQIISAQFDADMVDRLRLLAQRAERSLSAELRVAVAGHVEREIEKVASSELTPDELLRRVDELLARRGEFKPISDRGGNQ